MRSRPTWSDRRAFAFHLTAWAAGCPPFWGGTSAPRVRDAPRRVRGTELEIEDNPGFTSLAGLPALTTITGDATIAGNSALSALDRSTFLPALTAIQGTLTIQDNPCLPAAQAEAWVDGVSTADTVFSANAGPCAR